MAGKSSNARRVGVRQLLLDRREPSSSLVARCRRRMSADVSCSWADLVLLLCYIVTGLLDSASTQVWGAFVSMQTGLFPASSTTTLR